MILTNSADNISPAESTRHSWDEEDKRQAREYDLQCRKLELDIIRTESNWNSFFKLPITIIRMPVYIIMAFGYVVAMIRGNEPSQNFWDFIK